LLSKIVTGAVAELWRGCRACTSEQVISCVLDTALDLGDPGRDDEFGEGLLQARLALECLVNDIGCCVAQMQSSASSAPSVVEAGIPPSSNSTVISNGNIRNTKPYNFNLLKL